MAQLPPTEVSSTLTIVVVHVIKNILCSTLCRKLLRTKRINVYWEAYFPAPHGLQYLRYLCSCSSTVVVGHWQPSHFRYSAVTKLLTDRISIHWARLLQIIRRSWYRTLTNILLNSRCHWTVKWLNEKWKTQQRIFTVDTKSWRACFLIQHVMWLWHSDTPTVWNKFRWRSTNEHLATDLVTLRYVYRKSFLLTCSRRRRRRSRDATTRDWWRNDHRWRRPPAWRTRCGVDASPWTTIS